MIINPTWEACFVADTHAMKSSRVWEAYFAADTQNVKTGRYNKGTLYSKMFVVGVLYFGKRTISSTLTNICRSHG